MANERFVSLDAGRGVGAFSVVLWHWSHFFDQGVHPSAGEVSTRPFSEIFYWLYSYGWMGVEFFFALSGFIFFHYYYGLIQDRRIGAGEFFKRRFARLYPLYGLTLLIVIVLQEVYRQQHGSNFVYPPGTAADLLQAVTLTSHWWPNQEFSSTDQVGQSPSSASCTRYSSSALDSQGIGAFGCFSRCLQSAWRLAFCTGQLVRAWCHFFPARWSASAWACSCGPVGTCARPARFC